MPMTYVLDPVAAGWMMLGLIVGLLIGRVTWGRASRRYRRAAESVSNAAAAASARTQADAAQRELVAAQAAMRPLADEVDRLKRELTKARRPVQTTLPLASAPPAADSLGVAGTGPIVVGDEATLAAATGVPDIRRLKGVGDKFATALEGLGLGSIDRLARLNADEAAEADTRLGAFNGRIARDRLVEQCVLLDEGRTTEYEATFGKLGGPILV